MENAKKTLVFRFFCKKTQFVLTNVKKMYYNSVYEINLVILFSGGY